MRLLKNTALCFMIGMVVTYIAAELTRVLVTDPACDAAFRKPGVTITSHFSLPQWRIECTVTPVGQTLPISGMTP